MLRISQVLHVRLSISWTIWSFLDVWSSSMDNFIIVHGRFHCSWVIFSSMNIFLILGWFLILLALWVLDDTFGRIGDKLIFHYSIRMHIDISIWLKLFQYTNHNDFWQLPNSWQFQQKPAQHILGLEVKYFLIKLVLNLTGMCSTNKLELLY